MSRSTSAMDIRIAHRQVFSIKLSLGICGEDLRSSGAAEDTLMVRRRPLVFESGAVESAWARSWARAASYAAHFALVAVLIRVPAPQFIKVNPVMRGDGGSSVELVFTGTGDGAAPEAAHQVQRLPLPPPAERKKLQERAKLSRHPDVAPKEGSGTPARAGSPTGSALFGDLRGRDVRPAIPMSWADPEVFPWQVTQEGRVVVEITIDAQGVVINARVIESLQRLIDEKVLEAAWKWRFRPATVDGVPIASRQDLIFRFPS